MSKNEYLPFGTAGGANVLTPTAYGQLAARGVGFAVGVAKSKELNTVWRQASVIAAMVAQFIANRSGDDVLDDGNLNKLQASLEKALKAKIIDSALSLYPGALTVDLNTLGAATQAGVYCQPENAGATTDKHYPVNLAGTLMVTPSAYGCQQEYTTYSTRQKFVRGLTGPWNGKDGPWSDWASPPAYGWGMGPQHRDDAYNNVAMLYRVNGTSVNAPGPNVYGVISMPCDGGPSTAYLAVQNSGRAFVGYSNLPANGVIWTEVYTVKNPPTAAGINAADVHNNMAAKMGVSRVITGAELPTAPGVWSVENSTWAPTGFGSMLVTTNQGNLDTTPGNQKFIHYLQICHGSKYKLRAATNVNGSFSGWETYLPTSGGLVDGEVQSTSANILRGIQGGYGQIIRMDANALYFLQTNANDPNGNYNSNRSLTISNSGSVSIGTSLSVDSLNSIYKTGVNTYSDGGGSYHQTNGMTLQGAGDQVGEMYFLENIGKYAALGLHIKSGGRDAWVEFRNDGDFYINGTNVAPVGVIEAWPSDVPPTGWLLCDGSGFNTGVFPSLARIFPSGHLPDLRGAFLRGKDNGKGVDPNRGLLSIQPGQAPASGLKRGPWGNYAGRDTGVQTMIGTDNDGYPNISQETEQQRETRPYNVAINYIVRAA